MRVLALLLLLALPCLARPLDGMVLVLDPGHGDAGSAKVPADPGVGAPSLYGQAWECVFTWDTAMRLKAVAEARGARVCLTLQDPRGDYAPHEWALDCFPQPGEGFRYKTLAGCPEPETVDEALLARVDTANAAYRRYSADHAVYVISLHFDSTSPCLAGVSFYYPTWCGPGGFVGALEDELRRAGRARVDLTDGAENQVSQAHFYTVLSESVNPDSYLVELGNIRSQDDQGGDPDLWRMRDPRVRQEYAEIIADALARAPASTARRPRRRRAFQAAW